MPPLPTPLPASRFRVLRSRPPFTGLLRGPSLKVPHGVLFGQFWAGAQNCPKSTPWGTFRLGPWSSPVNGGRDRNSSRFSVVFESTLSWLLVTTWKRLENDLNTIGYPELECRKWGFKRWGFKQMWGYLRKKAFFLRFLDFPGALRTLRKWVKKAETGRKRPLSADFREGRPDTP